MNPKIAARYFSGRGPSSEDPQPVSTELPVPNPAAVRFTSVAIPDLRNQDFAALSQNAVAFEREHKEMVSDNRAMETPAESGTRPRHSSRGATKPDNAPSVPLATLADQSSGTGQDVAPHKQIDATPTLSLSGRASLLAHMNHEQPEIQSIVDSVLESSAAIGTSIVLFAATDENHQLDAAISSAAIATQLRTGKKILLVDSDFEHGGLTYAMECVGQLGLADLFSGGQQLPNSINSTTHQDLDFMPLGKVMLDTPDRMQAALGDAIASLGAGYGHIFVNVGDAHSQAASLWSRYASGSYLLVSVKNSNQTIAKSAVTHLNSCGARLIGCIVSEISD